jgi:flagellum-specific ATP synthase
MLAIDERCAEADFAEQLRRILPYGLRGRVVRIVGLTAAIAGFPAPLGALCTIHRDDGQELLAEVIGFHNDDTLVQPYGDLSGIRRGNNVTLFRSAPGIRFGERLLGRVINAQGAFIDGRPTTVLPHRAPLMREPVSPLDRPRISQVLATGVRVLDGLLTCGRGQRMGIFAGSGVGKSTLMGMLARKSAADVNVVVLVGERGREVREFLEKDLGPEGLARSVVVVATGDEPALLRLRAAYTGTAIAEAFRDAGRNVLLMMDSVTRFALAQREIGLAAGEPPATRGYPPSVFALLPRLLERSGQTNQGSITAFYTVLVEGDDTNEPISDTVRGILDGHIVLSRKLAHETHWPAIDVLQSISRSMSDIVAPEHRAASDRLKQLLAAHRQAEDLLSIGAYQSGSNPLVDTAVRLKDEINRFLRQSKDEATPFPETLQRLGQLDALRSQIKK